MPMAGRNTSGRAQLPTRTRIQPTTPHPCMRTPRTLWLALGRHQTEGDGPPEAPPATRALRRPVQGQTGTLLQGPWPGAADPPPEQTAETTPPHSHMQTTTQPAWAAKDHQLHSYSANAMRQNAITGSWGWAQQSTKAAGQSTAPRCSPDLEAKCLHLGNHPAPSKGLKSGDHSSFNPFLQRPLLPPPPNTNTNRTYRARTHANTHTHTRTHAHTAHARKHTHAHTHARAHTLAHKSSSSTTTYRRSPKSSLPYGTHTSTPPSLPPSPLSHSHSHGHARTRTQTHKRERTRKSGQPPTCTCGGDAYLHCSWLIGGHTAPVSTDAQHGFNWLQVRPRFLHCYILRVPGKLLLQTLHVRHKLVRCKVAAPGGRFPPVTKRLNNQLAGGSGGGSRQRQTGSSRGV